MRVCTAVCLAALAFGADCSNMMAQTLTTLATFNGSNGDLPGAGMVADSAGNLYGTTFNGGDFGYGTVFKLDAVTHALTSVGSFNVTNGANPINFGHLLIDAQGNLYGTTAFGGANHAGTVFEWSATTRQITTLATFNAGTTGSWIYGALSVDSSGDMFGAAQFGGPGNGGSIFEIPAATHSLTTLKLLTNQDPSTGWQPVSAPIADGHGNIYGVTATTVYTIDLATQRFTTLATFNGDNGRTPTGLVWGPGGMMYGVTRGGGLNNTGEVFRFNPSTDALDVLASLDGNNNDPTTPPVFGPDGNLYATTYAGGPTGTELGTVFKFDLSTNQISVIASFDGTNGANPFASLVVGPDGNLYGTTTDDALRPNALGNVFEVELPEPTLGLLVIASAALLPRRR